MNQRGFGVIAVLFLIPVLFLAGLLTFFGFDLVHRQTQAQDICRDHLLRAQKELGDHLSDLLALNPVAEKLRAQEKELKLKIAASQSHPPLSTYYQQQLAQNIQSQMSLRLKQQQLIRNGEWGAKQVLLKLKNNLKTQNAMEPHLYVEKTPVTAIAASYKPQVFFSKKQNLQVKWEKEIDSSFLKWIPELSRKLNGECSATLKKEVGGDTWNAKITDVKFRADKLLSKSRL